MRHSLLVSLFIVLAAPALLAQDGGRDAVAFTLPDTTGQTQSLALDDERIVVLEWTNKDCPFVIRHYKQERTMQKLAEQYGAKGVVWLSIDSTNYAKAEKLESWRKEMGITFPILQDLDGEVARAYGAKSSPHLFVVKTGKILYEGAIDDYKQGGVATVNYVAKALDEILEGKPVSTASTKPYGCSLKLAAEKKKAKTVKAEWHENYQEALKLAKEHKRPVLVDFTGSDWCGWCIKLKEEVFSKPEFQKWAEKNVVLLELDYPKQKQQSDEIKAQNAELKQKYKITGYPTILFIDHKGEVIGRSGYKPGGPEAWCKDAEEQMKK